MEWVVMKLSLWFTMALVFQMNGYNCCLEKERKALLDIKDFFKSVSTVDLDRVLPSWVDDKRSDCCGWVGIKCNPTTRRVTELSIFGQRQWVNDEEHHPILNTSLFHTFNQELETLDLDWNNFGGISNDYKGDANFGSLRKLKTLNLGRNRLNASIFSNLIGLNSVTTLKLYDNVIESIPPRKLATFRNLEILDLRANYLNKSLSIQGDANFGSLRKLKTLNLGNNYLNASIFSSLTGLDSLTTLDLSDNVIESIPSRRLTTFRNLEILDLSRNYLNNSLSIQGDVNFRTLKKLKTLDMGHNHLNDSIFSNLIGLDSLTTLYLYGNDIESIPPKRLANLQNLEVLDLRYNYINNALSIQEFVRSNLL